MPDAPWHAWLDRITAALEVVVAPDGQRIEEWVAMRGPAFPAIRIYWEITLDDGGHFLGFIVDAPITEDDLGLLELVMDALDEEGRGNLCWRPRDRPVREQWVRPPRPFSDFIE